MASKDNGVQETSLDDVEIGIDGSLRFRATTVDRDGVQETSLDEVEVDEDGNLRFADTSFDETDTDGVEVDDDGNLRIASAARLLNERKDQVEASMSPGERQSLQKRQADKRHYAGNGSIEEGIEMLAVGSSGDDVDNGESYVDRPRLAEHDLCEIELTVLERPRSGSVPSVELAEYHRPDTGANSMERGETYSTRANITGLGRVGAFISRSSPQKLAVIGAVIVVIIGVLLTVGLVPASFVYVEYYELALAKNRVSGRVNRDDTYHPGCYLLTPDILLVRFQGTAHHVSMTLSIFTSDRLSFDLGITLQYFIKPEELGILFTNYAHDYRPVVEHMIESTVKNTAVNFDLDAFRLNRSHVEKVLRKAVALRLSGDCCPSCCPFRCGSRSKVDCHACRLAGRGCSQGVHMDLKYFQMGQVDVPEEVSERFLRQTILQIEAEKELFVQKYAVQIKKTEQKTKDIINKAAEIRDEAKAEARKIRLIAEADYEKTVQTSYAEALKKLYQRLNITQEDHKLSLMYIRALEDISDNLYNLDYDQLSSYN